MTVTEAATASSSIPAASLDNSNDRYYDPPRIVYSVVSKEKDTIHSGRTQFVRFKATEECTDGSHESLTVRRWAYLLSSQNNNQHSQKTLALQLTNILKGAPYNAFFFETKGVRPSNAGSKQFEFALIDAPGLYLFADGQPDRETFREHLDCVSSSDEYNNPVGCQFLNLGGDSTLVSPKQLKRYDDDDEDFSGNKVVNIAVYAHLAAFVRGAPKSQIITLWGMIGSTYYTLLSQDANRNDKSVWLSTEGSGVAWLHFRFDPRPKYYHYYPFANES